MGSKTTWYSGFVSSNRRSIEVRNSSTDCLVGSPTQAKTDRGDPHRSRVRHAGTRAVRRRRRRRVRRRVDRLRLAVGRRHTEVTRRRRAYTPRLVVRTIAPRGKPVSGEANTNIVLTAATHDGGDGGVDAVNLADTALVTVSFTAFEDRLRTDISNRVLSYVHMRGRWFQRGRENRYVALACALDWNAPALLKSYSSDTFSSETAGR